MPVLGLGTWQLTHDTAGTVEEALRRGYRMIDTSGDYGTQSGVGEAIRRSGVDRSDIFIVTKVEEDEDAYEATRCNPDELGLNYADLVLIHRRRGRASVRRVGPGASRFARPHLAPGRYPATWG